MSAHFGSQLFTASNRPQKKGRQADESRSTETWSGLPKAIFGGKPPMPLPEETIRR